jgi:hypothetical protein
MITPVLFFKYMLSRYRLPDQGEGEEIIKIIHPAFFVLIIKIAGFLVLNLLPMVFFYLMLLTFPETLAGDVAWPLIILGASIYYLSMWMLFFLSFINYYLDVWIVTNHRIIDMEQNGLFARTVSEEKIEMVQDITSEVDGFFPTIFSYGNIYIQTAGKLERFHFEQVPHPEAIRDLIIKLADDNKKKEKQ